jgi:hypothetical protein
MDVRRLSRRLDMNGLGVYHVNWFATRRDDGESIADKEKRKKKKDDSYIEKHANATICNGTSNSA